VKFFVLFTSLALVVLQGCATGKSVCRERTTYASELEFFDQAAGRSATALEGFVRQHCVCQDGKFVMSECEAAAKVVVVVKTRLPWHRAMALHNAGIVKERPPETPPVIPAPETLCPPENDK